MPTARSLRLWQSHLRNPDFWLRAICVTVLVALFIQLLLFAHGRDQSIYATVADGMLAGKLPYRDVWDFKPPGIFFVFALAQALFGDGMWGVRLLEGLGLVLVFVLSIRLSSIYFADDRPGFLGGAMAALISVQMEFWHSGQPETFGGVLTMLGIWCCAVSAGKREAVWLFACGVAFGAAFLLKPPLGGGALICAAYVARSRLDQTRRFGAALRPVLLVGLGALLPIAVVAAWFALRGGWPALSWTLFVFTPGYTKLGWGDNAPGAYYLAIQHAFMGYSALTAVGAAAAAIGAPTSSREREGLALFFGIIAIHLAGIAMQAKFFPYHFNATLMLISFVAGLGWFKIWRKAIARGAGGAVAFGSLVLLTAVARVPVTDVPRGFWERCLIRFQYLLGTSEFKTRADLDRELYRAADFSLSADRDVAKRVRDLSAPGDHVFVWGFEPLIYLLSQREPSSRFIYDVPQRTSWESAYARTALIDDLGRNPPKVFVVQHNDYFKFVTGNDDDSAQALGSFPQLAALLEKSYAESDHIEDFDIYVRR
jgi:hypothetical protein